MDPGVRAPHAVIAGASGFIGTRLAVELAADGYRVSRIGRSGPDAGWDDAAALRRTVDGADLLVNLAGRSVGCRYTDRNREEIYRSRIDTTTALAAAIRAADRPPPVWLNASTATIYRYATDRPQTETDGEIGSGFSVDVARDWEQACLEPDLPHTRRSTLRMAIVLGDGPALNMLTRAARLGAGGPHYDGWWFRHRRYRGIGPTPTQPAAPGQHSKGRQRFSWIHLDDVIATIRFVADHEDLAGPVNLAAPHPGTNVELMALLRRAVRMPIGLRAYRWMLEPGLWALRQESELLLKSRWVLPERLLAAGFTFHWPDLSPVISDLVRSCLPVPSHQR